MKIISEYSIVLRKIYGLVRQHDWRIGYNAELDELVRLRWERPDA